ncbi:MAG TPA: hypothetical protein VGG75_37955 [Trebonia sp.]|jgi:hypothetical protein
MTSTDRYLLAGGSVPRIYPPLLKNLLQAYGDAAAVSAREPGQHVLFMIRGQERMPLQVYEFGICTWMTGQQYPRE